MWPFAGKEASRHKAHLEALKSQDQEFYAYLEQTDRELLDFDAGSESDAEEIEEDTAQPVDESDSAAEVWSIILLLDGASCILHPASCIQQARGSLHLSWHGLQEERLLESEDKPSLRERSRIWRSGAAAQTAVLCTPCQKAKLSCLPLCAVSTQHADLPAAALVCACIAQL